MKNKSKQNEPFGGGIRKALSSLTRKIKFSYSFCASAIILSTSANGTSS